MLILCKWLCYAYKHKKYAWKHTYWNVWPGRKMGICLDMSRGWFRYYFDITHMLCIICKGSGQLKKFAEFRPLWGWVSRNLESLGLFCHKYFYSLWPFFRKSNRDQTNTGHSVSIPRHSHPSWLWKIIRWILLKNIIVINV